MTIPGNIKKISGTVWELPKTFKSGMRVPARIYATAKLLEDMEAGVFEQVTNVAKLPGIIKYAFCMPDGHWGYGFPIGGVAAFDLKEGVISPGGIGFDINCGMRLVTTNLSYDEIKPHLEKLVQRLFERIPSGVGGEGFVKVSKNEFRRVVEQGAKWCVKNGFGWQEDLERTEDGGCVTGADAAHVSEKALARGFKQMGTLGSGNHYLEIQVAKPEHVFDKRAAQVLGITMPNQIVIMFHCGSRGFGHQVATDYLQLFLKVMQSKYNLEVIDRELACAPFSSPEGQAYFSAMNCAINMAFANRQVILHRIREVFAAYFGRSAQALGMHQVYDVTHNTAKIENHIVDGEKRELLIHRKGSTRAYPPGATGVPGVFQSIGQPVIIGGSMETGSYLLVGVESGQETFYSTCHGSGRLLSRHQAKKQFNGRALQQQLQQKGIFIQTASFAGLAEEAGAAYKDIDDVIEATEQAGLSKKVVRLLPLGNVKG